MSTNLQPERPPVDHRGFPQDDRPFVETIFRPDGSVEVKAHGFQGGTCQDALAPYTKALAGDIVADAPTSEACLQPTGVAVPQGKQRA